MNTNNQYISLLKKYFPQNLHEIKYQPNVTQTLIHEIIYNRIHSSYLFYGTRGIGKTSTAKILAKTLNCCNIKTNLANIQIEICRNCKNCNNFSTHPDIIDINAATKTGVDDARAIIDNTCYKPILGKYKIYIIDEVHMLSQNAFNAFLKIMEETPKYIVFILITTQLSKIPLTIISRCQRFEFNKLTINQMYLFLSEIITKEKIQYDKTALEQLSYKSHGCIRDGLILLEQSISFIQHNNHTKIRLQDINKILHIIDVEILLELINAIIEKNTIKALQTVKIIYNYTHNIQNIIENINTVITHLCTSKITKKYNNTFDSITKINKIKSLLNKITIKQLLNLRHVFTQYTNNYYYNQCSNIEIIILDIIYNIL